MSPGEGGGHCFLAALHPALAARLSRSSIPLGKPGVILHRNPIPASPSSCTLFLTSQTSSASFLLWFNNSLMDFKVILSYFPFYSSFFFASIRGYLRGWERSWTSREAEHLWRKRRERSLAATSPFSPLFSRLILAWRQCHNTHRICPLPTHPIPMGKPTKPFGTASGPLNGCPPTPGGHGWEAAGQEGRGQPPPLALLVNPLRPLPPQLPESFFPWRPKRDPGSCSCSSNSHFPPFPPYFSPYLPYFPFLPFLSSLFLLPPLFLPLFIPFYLLSPLFLLFSSP